MASLNLFSVFGILSSDNNELINDFLRINGIKLKAHEFSGFRLTLQHLFEAGVNGKKASGYYIGLLCSNLMQEEFDILRFTNRSILNIEIKSSMPAKGIINQMQRHMHLLKTLDKEVFCVSFIEDEDVLYQYEDGSMREITFDYLISLIEEDYVDNNLLDSIDVSTILVSPYSQPDIFSEHKYFLTNQQDEFKRNILASTSKYIALSGKAGSGKSLLLFDIAKSLMEQNYTVCIVFCANMSQHEYISEKTGVLIKSIKDFRIEDINNYDIVLFDEAQRLRKEQLNSIIDKFIGKQLIFSLDQQQTLHTAEIKLNVEEKIINLQDAEYYSLSNKIRINVEVESFAKKLLFYNCPHWQPTKYNCIKLTYFSNKENLTDYCSERRKSGVTIIELTPYTTKSTYNLKMPKLYSLSEDSHSVIGQEFDNVIVILNKYFTYVENENGEVMLSTNYPEYYPFDENHCVWEAISRTKKTLEIVVVENPILYNKIGKILVF